MLVGERGSRGRKMQQDPCLLSVLPGLPVFDAIPDPRVHFTQKNRCQVPTRKEAIGRRGLRRWRILFGECCQLQINASGRRKLQYCSERENEGAVCGLGLKWTAEKEGEPGCIKLLIGWLRKNSAEQKFSSYFQHNFSQNNRQTKKPPSQEDS